MTEVIEHTPDDLRCRCPLCVAARRRAAIIRLLKGWREASDLTEPSVARRQYAARGFVHGVQHPVACPDCLANDRVMFGCETCGGRGYTLELHEHDPYAVSKVQPYGLDERRHERTHERDAQIDRLSAQLREPEIKSAQDELAAANRHPYAWEIAKQRMYDRFDYGPLDQQLELIRDTDVGAWHALHAAYVYGWAEPSTVFESACERGLRLLEEALPAPLRAPREEPAAKLAKGRVERGVGRDAMKERDNEIRRAVLEARLPTADVARTWGITSRQVNRIVARDEEDA